jgi:Ankyrin repeat
MSMKRAVNYKKNNEVSYLDNEDEQCVPNPPKDTLSYLVFSNNLKKLIEKLGELDPNTRDNTGATHSWTPLYWSVKLRKVDVIKTLLEHGADINVVVHDESECCGTVLDLVTLRGDSEIEVILREFADKEEINMGQSFKAIRTKLRGKSPAFNFWFICF